MVTISLTEKWAGLNAPVQPSTAGQIRHKKGGSTEVPPPWSLCNFVQINDKSERIADCKYVRIISLWSEWGDSNSRHLAPKP